MDARYVANTKCIRFSSYAPETVQVVTNVLAGRIQICCKTEYDGVKIRENSAFWHHFLLDCPGVQMLPSSFTPSHLVATSSPPATVLSITPCPKQIPFKERIPLLNSVTFLLFQIIVALSFPPSVFSLRGIFSSLNSHTTLFQIA